ncbi:MAG: glutamine--fructose-6-phosphate transaminase (isomerizing) [Solibacterales bacterium]|nr:glutamine--fructose-6-phosphate transaminase (isomerizing) [Bryobacterales bacterium]|tara:strand:+ start:47706 stop:49565 length:1860 start_codon:yes stop_codon:yes gene_type:complete
MCGIVGYIGPNEAAPILVDSLRRLEYRGYDSAGLVVSDNGNEFQLRRAAGKLRNLEKTLRTSPVGGNYGIGHTRWATHGRPTEENAHPHRDSTGDIVVVHNGIVENYLTLKAELEKTGCKFATETDTEVIAQLVAELSADGTPLEEALRLSVQKLQGVFALALISSRDPNKIVVARSGPPAVVGIGQDEYFVASDVPAILHHTRDMFFLSDGDIAVLTSRGVRVTDFKGRSLNPSVQHVLWDPVMTEKGGYRHFMLKEIFEQPSSVRDTLLGRVARSSGEVFLDEMEITQKEFAAIEHVRMVACGTSWHAALAAKFIIERLAGIPVEVDYGSEFRYRDPILGGETLTVLISQSGETADTLAAQREAIGKGSKTLAICNVLGSMLTREAAGTIYTHAGPEIGVASTKAFTCQLTALFLLALHLSRVKDQCATRELQRIIDELLIIPSKLEAVLANHEQYEALARSLFRAQGFLFLGRGVHYPIALEGALKLKEISYIHAEGYPAGEMKHGPNALLDEHLPVVAIATQDPNDESSRIRYEKTVANIKEVQARQARVIALATQNNHKLNDFVEDVIEIPPAPELLSPILEIVPLQLLAYHIGVLRGCDVDQPRNLAKSVTVE